MHVTTQLNTPTVLVPTHISFDTALGAIMEFAESDLPGGCFSRWIVQQLMNAARLIREKLDKLEDSHEG